MAELELYIDGRKDECERIVKYLNKQHEVTVRCRNECIDNSDYEGAARYQNEAVLIHKLRADIIGGV